MYYSNVCHCSAGQRVLSSYKPTTQSSVVTEYVIDHTTHQQFTKGATKMTLYTTAGIYIINLIRTGTASVEFIIRKVKS